MCGIQGQQEVYSSHEELVSQGIDPVHLMGLINEDDEDGEDYERDMFNYKDDYGMCCEL